MLLIYWTKYKSGSIKDISFLFTVNFWNKQHKQAKITEIKQENPDAIIWRVF